jgi:hypothetical protein
MHWKDCGTWCCRRRWKGESIWPLKVPVIVEVTACNLLMALLEISDDMIARDAMD